MKKIIFSLMNALVGQGFTRPRAYEIAKELAAKESLCIIRFFHHGKKKIVRRVVDMNGKYFAAKKTLKDGLGFLFVEIAKVIAEKNPTIMAKEDFEII